MSNKAQNWVYDHSESRGNARLVMIAIADEADDDGRGAYPSIKRIAHKARVNERTCIRAIESLEALGELEVTRPETRGRGRFNTYRVLMGKGDNLAPFAAPETVRNGDNARRRNVRKGAAVVPDRVVDPLTLVDPITLSRAPDAFERFWKVYPKKADRRAAERAWKAAVKRADPETIVRAVEPYARTADPRYTKNPATWLNADAWLNEYPDHDEERGYVVH